MNYGSSTSSGKPWGHVRLDLIVMMRDIYIIYNLNPLTKFTSSSRSTEFEYFLASIISQMTMKTITISTRTALSYTMKRGTPFWVWQKSMETQTTLSEFPNVGKAISKQTLKSQKRNKSKRKSQSGIQVGNIKNLSKVIWDYNRVYQVYQFFFFQL